MRVVSSRWRVKGKLYTSLLRVLLEGGLVVGFEREFVLERGFFCGVAFRSGMISLPLPRTMGLTIDPRLGSRSQPQKARMVKCPLAIDPSKTSLFFLNHYRFQGRFLEYGLHSVRSPSILSPVDSPRLPDLSKKYHHVLAIAPRNEKRVRSKPQINRFPWLI